MKGIPSNMQIYANLVAWRHCHSLWLWCCYCDRCLIQVERQNAIEIWKRRVHWAFRDASPSTYNARRLVPWHKLGCWLLTIDQSASGAQLDATANTRQYCTRVSICPNCGSSMLFISSCCHLMLGDPVFATSWDHESRGWKLRSCSSDSGASWRPWVSSEKNHSDSSDSSFKIFRVRGNGNHLKFCNTLSLVLQVYFEWLHAFGKFSACDYCF